MASVRLAEHVGIFDEILNAGIGGGQHDDGIAQGIEPRVRAENVEQHRAEADHGRGRFDLAGPRRGDKKYLCALLDKLRERIPGLVLRTSIIAGLPGEGEEEFDELCDFLREQKLLRAGVFPYSPEEGTRAAKMERVDSDEAARRAERIVDIQSEIIDAWNDERQGDVMEVLCEGFDGQSMLFVGRSYAESPDIDGRIYFSAPRDVAAGEFVPVRITGAMDGELTGELAEE